MTDTDINWRHGLGTLCIGMALISSLQGCQSMAKLARSDTGKALLCGGGSIATGAAAYFACDAITGMVNKGKTKAEIEAQRTACMVLAAASAMADGFSCWWKLSEKIVEDYDQTKEALGYDASQGYVVKILEFDAMPKIVRPGDEVKIRVKYALMSPNPTDEIKFERKITLPGDNKPTIQILTYQPGTWGTDSDYSFTIDKTTPEGKIVLTLEINLLDHGKQDRRTLCFNVTNQNQLDSAQLCPAEVKDEVKKSKLFVVSNVKQFANVCIEPDNNCKSSKSKKFLAMAPLNEQFPLIDEAMYDSKLWYKIRLKDGREGWLRESTGTVVEE